MLAPAITCSPAATASLPLRRDVPAKAAFTFNGRMSVLGDSISSTARYLTDAATDDRLLTISYLTWSRFYTREGFVCDPVADNYGVSGETAAQIAARKASAAANASNLVTVLAGTNDITTATTAGAICQSLAEIYRYLIAAGKQVIAMDIPPRGSLTSLQKTKLKAVNAWIAQTASQHPAIHHCRYYHLMADSSDDPITNMLSDGVHPAPRGACIMGAAHAAIVNKLKGKLARWPVGTGNVLYNRTLTGTGGTLNGGATGAAATGYALYGAANLTCTGSKDVTGDFQIITLSATSGAGQVSSDFQRNHTTDFSSGQVWIAQADVEFVSGSNIYWHGLEMLTGTVVHQARGLYRLTGYPIAGDKGRGVITTPPLTVPVGATYLRPYLRIGLDATSADASAVVKLRSIDLIRLS